MHLSLVLVLNKRLQLDCRDNIRKETIERLELEETLKII